MCCKEGRNLTHVSLRIKGRADGSSVQRREAVSSSLPARPARADTPGMHRRLVLSEVLDKHRVMCPRCRCPEAVVLIDAQFEVSWQCVDCESRWPANDDETELLLGSALKTIH